MKELLITFAFLLLLLTLLSTFGGSIRPGEPFYQPALQSPYESRKTLQENQLYSSTNEISEQFINTTPNIPTSIPQQITQPSIDPLSLIEKKKENYLTGAPIEDHLERPIHISEQYTDRKPQHARQPQQHQEGFMIEPFESDNGPTFASF
jgi:hypothetical protein